MSLSPGSRATKKRPKNKPQDSPHKPMEGVIDTGGVKVDRLSTVFLPANQTKAAAGPAPAGK
jgi:hypothetical protein